MNGNQLRRMIIYYFPRMSLVPVHDISYTYFITYYKYSLEYFSNGGISILHIHYPVGRFCKTK